MANRFARFDDIGTPLAFYSDDVMAREQMPVDVVALTAEQYAAMRSVKGRRLVGGVIVEPVVDPEALQAAMKEDLGHAIQSHVDKVARARDADSGVLLASYVTSTIPAWAADAVAFIAWRDAVWLACYGVLADVEAGTRAIPSHAELIGLLPDPPWQVPS